MAKFSNKIGTQVLVYYTGNFAQISVGKWEFIWRSRALANVGLWRRVHKMQIGVTQKIWCFGKPWVFEKGIKSWTSHSETCTFEYRPHIRPVGPICVCISGYYLDYHLDLCLCEGHWFDGVKRCFGSKHMLSLPFSHECRDNFSKHFVFRKVMCGEDSERKDLAAYKAIENHMLDKIQLYYHMLLLPVFSKIRNHNRF